MAPEGQLRIDLARDGLGAGRCTITSSRPLGISRAFAGQTPEDVVRTLPLIFNVCGMAQGAAAAQAVEQALGVTASVSARSTRRLLVLAENARELLLQIVMDWPPFVKRAQDDAVLLRVMRASAQLASAIDPTRQALSIGPGVALDRPGILAAIADLKQIIDGEVLGEPAEQFLCRHASSEIAVWCGRKETAAQSVLETVVRNGWQDACRAPVSLLPSVPENELAEHMLGDNGARFVAAPTWAGMPRETGTFSRQASKPLMRDLTRMYGNGLLTRLAARLIELASLPDALQAALDNGADDDVPTRQRHTSLGLAQVEAARGRLAHACELKNGRVLRYAILAPTEWNFHPRGCAAAGLAALDYSMLGARDIAELFVATIDPCVSADVRIH